MIILLKILFVVIVMTFTTVWAVEPLVVKPGVWPENFKHINSVTNNGRVVFSSRNITVEKEQLIKPIVIKIDTNAVFYLSSKTRVRAQPKVYTHPELSNEVKRFYQQGVGNYAFWATLIGVAAFIQ